MIKDTVSKIKQLFNERKVSYCLTFKKDDRANKAVLEDLARFCRANETTFAADVRASAVLEGRREVWLRIQNYLNLTVDELYDIHHIRTKGE